MTERDDVFIVDDIATFEVLGSPIRQRLMRTFDEPRSVKAAAEELGVPVTRLYHHVNLLADHGVIEVVEQRKAGAMIEKIYETVAKQFRPGPGLLESEHDPAELARITVSVVLDPARAEAEAALTSEFAAGKPRAVAATIGRSQARLTPARAEQVAAKVLELLEELEADDDDEDATEYALSATFFPIGLV